MAYKFFPLNWIIVSVSHLSLSQYLNFRGDTDANQNFVSFEDKPFFFFFRGLQLSFSPLGPCIKNLYPGYMHVCENFALVLCGSWCPLLICICLRPFKLRFCLNISEVFLQFLSLSLLLFQLFFFSSHCTTYDSKGSSVFFSS